MVLVRQQWRDHGTSILNFATTASPYDAVRHPIQRLHPELLAEIFTYCVPDLININGQFHPISIRDAPLLLCRVCTSWYSLAVSTPRLWQRFSIDAGRVFIVGQHNPVLGSLPRGIRTWLGRSGSLPLDIRFVLSGRKIIATNALEALFKFSSRWNSIMIEVSPTVPWPDIGVLPNLRVFEGSFLPINQFPFTSAPSLKVIRVYKLPLNPVSISRIPWSQLTELIVDLVAPTLAVLEILRGCPLLERLTIPIGDGMTSIDSSLPLPSAKHDTLHSLWLYVISDLAGPLTVEFLALPALKNLYLSGWSGKFDPYSHSQVLDLLTRSKCDLQGLAITQSTFEPENFLEYLNHPSCQTLTSLDISEQDEGGKDVISLLDGQVLSHLTYSEEQGNVPLCPRLVNLRFRTCYRSEVGKAANAMGRMIQSRCIRCTSDEQLRSLDLVTRYPISQEDGELLQRARDEGGLKLSYMALEEYPVEEEVPSGACYHCYNSGIPGNACQCYVPGKQRENEEMDDNFNEEVLDDDEGEEDSDDDGSEEDSDDYGSSGEDSDDDGSEENSDDDSVREGSCFELTIEFKPAKAGTLSGFEEGSGERAVER